ncbi:MAG: mechanosensitive ion channel family protein [candidate division WOR-3 bacterium]|nr:MAG: mechanosensitive ion channel family protein [candidate division WOR-3 bacterium]
MIEWLQVHGIKIAIIIILGGVAFLIAQRLVPRVIKKTILLRMRDKSDFIIKKRSKTISHVITNTIGILLGIIVLFTILGQIGVNIGPALASLGILGLAVSFGAQTLIKDLINGLFILMEDQYGIGDVVRVAGISGLVEDVNLRRTVLRDLDGIVHHIPNSEIGVASNFTKEYSRVNMNISVSYNEDLDRVIGVINRVCAEMVEEKNWRDKILKAPQVLRVDALGDSGIDIKILGDTRPSMQWEVMGELRKRIKNEFDREGIEIPWPHMKVYFGNSASEN